MVLKPERYAIVTGKSDNEHGPRLVSSPPMKTIAIINGLGECNPLIINSSLVWAKSEIGSSMEGIVLNSILYKCNV